MITESVKNLFGFIDFLHSKTEYFLSKQYLIDKVMDLHTKRNSLKPNQNFKDRIEYNKVQTEFEKEFDILNKETTIIIMEKILQLNIADISTPIINLNAHGDLFELQRNFNENDLKEIFEAKRKYVEFRTKTNFHYFLQFFFDDLDRDLKEFFDYFKETTENEFEAFETTTIQVNSIGETVELFQKEHTKFSLPIDFLNFSKIQYRKTKAEQQEDAESWKIVPLETAVFTNEDWKPLIEMMALHDFLSVPAPDVLHENAFWHDENDSPIDCNIYHFKYGYKGFETTSKEPIVTSFQPVTVYRDARTDKYIYCQYYQPMLCTADEINFTNKDGGKVIKVNHVQTHQKRLAENEQDFTTIYQREFNKKNLKDEQAVRFLFSDELINHIQDLMRLHRERTVFGKDRDLNVLALANGFIDYLEKVKNGSQTNNQSRTKKFILDEFENLDKVLSWQYAFASEADYNTFVDLLTNYFEYKPYSIPEKAIKLKKDCKTRSAKALRPIYKELRNENKKLKSDIEFFKIVRILNHYENMTDAEIYNAINR